MIALAIWKGYCVGFFLFLVANLFMFRFDRSKDKDRKALIGDMSKDAEKMGYGDKTVAAVIGFSLFVYSALWFWYIPKLLLTRRKENA